MILVAGSSNVDLVLRVPRFHRPGETMTAENLVTAYGGKGANQAVSAKRLGGKVLFLTRLGDDSFGGLYLRHLVREGLDRKYLLKARGTPTGVALIELNPAGENRILVSPGANRFLSVEDLERLRACWKEARVFLCQLEIPLQTVQKGLEMARAHGVMTALNPAPAGRLSPRIFPLVDYLVPNRSEAEFLTGIRMRRKEDPVRVAEKLLKMGVGQVIITLGSQGVLYHSRSETLRLKAFPVNVLDTTAAGDAFMGGLALGLAEGKPIREVLRFAAGAGALAATRLGAQPSLPTRGEVNAFLARFNRAGSY
jgi:ribokinase